jgi:zinc/manganese transport system substrate-binding protein
MRRRLLLAALLSAAAAPRVRAATTLPVVASFSILADMTTSIGGDLVRVTMLVPPDGDAHSYQPRPSDLRAMQAAAVLVENGLGLEGFMARMAKSSGFRGIRIVATQAVTPRRMREGAKTVTDPHAWQDPRNGVLYARNIAAGLIRALPEAADQLRARADAYVAEIEAADRFVTETLGAVPPDRRRIITSHDAFGYFAARYGIEMIGVQGLSTESEPSARDMARLVAQIRREHIRAVFVENMTDGRLAETLARESGAVVGGQVFSDALSPPGGPADTYVKMLRHNATLFAGAMLAGN